MKPAAAAAKPQPAKPSAPVYVKAPESPGLIGHIKAAQQKAAQQKAAAPAPMEGPAVDGLRRDLDSAIRYGADGRVLAPPSLGVVGAVQFGRGAR
jgi:hypothetical protein